MATETELVREVRDLLHLDADNPTRLTSRENSRLEYKERFNWGSRAKYGKTLAAFANNAGGFIVFGVQDSPRHLVGVNEETFDALNPADVSAYFNSAYAPELQWELFTTHVSGVRLGVLYVASAADRPVVSLRNDHREGIREADIFYRYRGRSERIRYQQLQRLLLERQQRERDSWMNLLSKVGRIGVENVGVLDFVGGQLSGPGGHLLVSSELLDKVQFIRKGHFAEVNEPGAPTLRLIGDVQAIPPHALGPVRTVPQPLVIGEREIMLGFLRQERPEAPVEYIRQACRESSQYMPIYHFSRCAGLGLERLRELVLAEPRRRNRLLSRVEGGTRVAPVGAFDARTPPALERRELFEIVTMGDVDSLQGRDRTRLFEAITHFTPRQVPTHLLSFLAELVENELDTMTSNVRTVCRKAIAHLDETLNLPSLGASAEPAGNGST